MARLAGMSHPGSASNAMRAIRKKLDARIPGGAGGSGSSAPNTPKKTPRSAAAGRKRAAASMTAAAASAALGEEEDTDGAMGVDTPSRKRLRGKTTKAEAGREGSGDEEQGSAVRVKRERAEEEMLEAEVVAEDDDDAGGFGESCFCVAVVRSLSSLLWEIDGCHRVSISR